MFRTLPGTADPLEVSEEKNPSLEKSTSKDDDSRSTEYNREDVEVASSPDLEDGDGGNENPRSKAPSESKRPGLSRITSRLTTHSITDPGPPPDGGFNAWVQVAMSWAAVLATWGWVNCYGVYATKSRYVRILADNWSLTRCVPNVLHSPP